MRKDWLIRTRSNLLLGPVSKKKIVELYSSGTIKKDDEVCCGNGYWFYIKEEDCVNKFIMGQESQPFNPVRDCETVIANGKFFFQEQKSSNVSSEEALLPDDEDLEYPDMGDDLVFGSSPDEKPSPSPKRERKKANKKLEVVEEDQATGVTESVAIKKSEQQKFLRKSIANEKEQAEQTRSFNLIGRLKENLFSFLLISVIALALWGLYKNFSTIKNILVEGVSGKLIDEADAQTLMPGPLKKK